MVKVEEIVREPAGERDQRRRKRRPNASLSEVETGTILVKLGFRGLPRSQLGTSVVSIGVPLQLPVGSGLYTGWEAVWR